MHPTHADACHLHACHAVGRSVGRSVVVALTVETMDGWIDGEMDGTPRRWDAETNGTTGKR